MHKIPLHIAWPAFIVALLVLGVGSGIAVLVASQSDGGVEIVDKYYDKAVKWDDEAALQAESARLGWRSDVRIERSADDVSTIFVLDLRDPAGKPIMGAQAELRAFRPQYAAPRSTVRLQESDVAGQYRQTVSIGEAGLWDFEVYIRKGADRFKERIRKDIVL